MNISKSIHITIKDFKDLSNEEIDKQAQDPNSELREQGRKGTLKKDVK